MSYHLRGLGELASESIPQPVYEQCNPLDSACIKRNQVKGDDWEAARIAADNAQHLQWCLTQSGYDPAGCYATYGSGGSIAAHANAGQPVQGFLAQPVLTAAQVQQTYNPGFVATPGITIDTPTGQVFVPTPDKTTSGTKSAPPVAVPPLAAGAPPLTLQSSVPPNGDTTVPLEDNPKGGFDIFDFSAIPTWGWLAAAAGVALFAFGKGGR